MTAALEKLIEVLLEHSLMTQGQVDECIQELEEKNPDSVESQEFLDLADREGTQKCYSNAGVTVAA